MKRNKNIKFAGDGISQIVLGAITYLGLILLFSAVAAALSMVADDPIGSSGAYSLIGAILAGAVGGIITSVGRSDGGIRHSAICAVVAVCVMLLSGIIIARGITSPSAFINYACIIGASTVFAYLFRKKGKRHGKRRMRRG